MSRIGKQTILIPPGVSAEKKDNVFIVKGPKGTLERTIHPKVAVAVNDGKVILNVQNEEEKFERSLWGTFASHIKNMIIGVTAGYKKELEINGVGYKVATQGKDLKLDVGFSHPIIYKTPEGIKISIDKNLITIEGADKELVGHVAAEIRAIRKPEPYKGKGIKYINEIIRRKAGKTAKTSAA
jgi:large subunit ribosomal protein L6